MKMIRFGKMQAVLALLLVALLCTGTVGCTYVKAYIAEGETETFLSENESGVQPVDAEAYLSSVGTILAKEAATSSDSVRSEAETVSEMDERGFLQYPVMSGYSTDSRYTGDREASGSSAQKHPIYETYYVTENGDVWEIKTVNGLVMANPVTYNTEHYETALVLFSETGTIMSYDSQTNCFFELEPDPSVIRVIRLEHIDAETIEQLTSEEIEKR